MVGDVRAHEHRAQLGPASGLQPEFEQREVARAEASSLLTEIDELTVKNYPVVAGDGIPVFGGRFQPRQFALVDSKTFGKGAIVTTFRPR